MTQTYCLLGSHNIPCDCFLSRTVCDSIYYNPCCVSFSVVGALEGALASDVTVEFCISECPGILRGLGLDMLSDSCEAACQQ